MEMEYPEEFKDLFLILDFGATKYPVNGWLNGIAFNHKKNHDSMFHHLAESYVGVTKDKESGHHPLLHLGCRAMMEYTLLKRGLLRDEIAN